MSHRPVLAAAVLAAAALATAAQADPRVATTFYRPDAVTVMHGRAGVESTIAFADDERIENVAVGDSAAWQVTPNKRANLLFVKPATSRARTNMTVVTDQHTYLFDLVGGAGGAPVYMLRFSYPPRPHAPPVKPGPEELALAAAAVAAAAAIPPPPDPAQLDFAWTKKGDKAILPTRVYDDGKSTFLAWDAEATLPAILVREASGQEGPVDYTSRGGVIVVDGVPPQLILRAGKQIATLTAGASPDVATKANDRDLADARPSRPYAHALDGRP